MVIFIKNNNTHIYIKGNAEGNVPFFPPTGQWTKSRTKLNSKMQNFKRVLNLILPVSMGKTVH